VPLFNSDELVVHKRENVEVWQVIPLLLAAVLLTIGLAMFMSGIQHAAEVVQPIIVVTIFSIIGRAARHRRKCCIN